ncbi:response regulator transcription factor [Aliarcobacter butzleri]|uniref:response regulator transcription factor n=2 Tax=Aliarcobacter butzleri TaxID=28197 RepID=UPI0021B1F50C|nr:response regulator transcription factor [Aliarcobacter butzleri]MCT7615424.1 response regulator transcription factor [Aliarcobacter butzleri]MCT7625150.1 response regulator transcription factor [Aliarcobacter butzleri]MCT7636774.1 response regulator transcription factor [Aliarcobacter butzleri]MCT7643198.1 response regulator transcription factor [Aliarcobacter butzleri]MDK2046797.1 response regulator transcription factor [Aliarcobacter butzleri]
MSKDILKNLKILIVEDEKRLAQLLKEAISDSFFKVIIAKDGIEGIKKYKSFKPDIIITDIMMPQLDGLDMTIKIKEIDSNIPIIVLSAHSEKEKLLKAIDVGINKYFIKPFDPDELIEHIKKLAPKIEKQKISLLKDTFIFDNNNFSLYKNELLINLTKREKEFIYLLIKNKNSLVKKEDIKTLLWNEDVSDERLRTFIKRLRLKTSKDLVENVSSQGYLISVFDN